MKQKLNTMAKLSLALEWLSMERAEATLPEIYRVRLQKKMEQVKRRREQVAKELGIPLDKPVDYDPRTRELSWKE
jgi:hypothetical protein